MRKGNIFWSCVIAASGISSSALGHAGPRIYLDIENGKVVTINGPYPPPEDSNGFVSTNPADYTDFAISRIFPGLPPDETEQSGQPTAGVLPLSWDDDPENFTTEFPGLQVYGPGSVPAGTQFSFNIMGEVQWFNTTTASFEPISEAFPINTPLIAVNNDLGQLAFSSTGFVPGYIAFDYSGDLTDHEHLTFTICTPDDLADGFSPEDAPAGVYALPLQLTSNAATTPSDTFYILFGDRGPNLTISQTAMDQEVYQATTLAYVQLGGGILGDTNRDGIINDTDLQTLIKYNGQTVDGGYTDGDFNGDGIVNQDDWALFILGAAEYDNSLSPAPEPATIGLAVVSLALLARRPSRR
jgi:hypothetical protein